MNISKQIASTNPSSEQNLMKLLNNSETIIRNLIAKRFFGVRLPYQMNWIKEYKKEGSSVEVYTGFKSKDTPYAVMRDGRVITTIPRVFIFGSVWEIASASRAMFYGMEEVDAWQGKCLIDWRFGNMEITDEVKKKMNEMISRIEKELLEIHPALNVNVLHDQKELRRHENKLAKSKAWKKAKKDKKA